MTAIRLIRIGALAVGVAVMSAGNAAAQSNELNKHYAALAAKYEREAADHAAMAQIARTLANPAESKRPGSPGTALHCDRLADYLRAAAREVRALVVANGDVVKVPEAARLTEEELIALLNHARTRTDHERLAGYYDGQAKGFELQMVKDRDTAAFYRSRPVSIFPKIAAPISYADYYETRALKASRQAKEASVMAEHHRMLAKDSSIPER